MLLFTFGINICREWKLGKVEIGRGEKDVGCFFDLDCVVLLASMHAQSAWACLLPRAPWYPGLLLRQRRFVPVNLQGCQFGTFPPSESREEGGEGQGRGRMLSVVRALSAGNAASGQRATLPLCCSVLQGCCLAASSQLPLPSRRKALLTCTSTIAS